MSRLLQTAAALGLLCIAAWAQGDFEAASIKLSTPADHGVMKGGPGTSSPGQWTANAVPLRVLITMAWNLREYQLAGPPDLDSTRYDIAAKIPTGTTSADFGGMLQKLLTERLALVVHHEPRDRQVFELVIAKGGIKMKEAEPPRPGDTSMDAMHLEKDKYGKPQLPPGRPIGLLSRHGSLNQYTARMHSMADIVGMIEERSGRPVIDKTGLTGKYDFVLEFAAENGGGSDEASTPGALFVTAVLQQLGLKLEPAKAAVDIVVVDRYHRVPREQ